MEDEPRTRDWLPRTVALLVGTLALATAFIAAYVGALHQPHPRDVPVGVVTGDQRAQALLTAVRARTDTIEPVGYDSPGAADDALTARQVYAVLTSAPDGTLTLATASASAPAATELVTQVLTPAAQQARLPLTVTDQVPVSPDDPRGLVPFYLAVGLVLGGYLASTALGVSLGTAHAGCAGPGCGSARWRCTRCCSGPSARCLSARCSASGTTTWSRWRRSAYSPSSPPRWWPPRCRAGWGCSAPGW